MSQGLSLELIKQALIILMSSSGRTRINSSYFQLQCTSVGLWDPRSARKANMVWRRGPVRLCVWMDCHGRARFFRRGLLAVPRRVVASKYIIIHPTAG